ncbi:ABC transporter ATP-binding protein [Lentisphaera profundi]|uniref:ABC transporter ATP-binding protein n=1 Tax=Lentisphaera profundi TaxID=1658616 RepID=A0ABY7VNX5_9BACT|nr:ABC transporter ATP-binding protein [Lentisphaera profundi]WDE95841.1 ABC transporter ATP-binding protein [Lentisphaera profundi]
MLSVDEVSRTFGDARTGEVQALKNVSFCLEPGETAGLLGMNGAGKSTLLRILATTLKASEGKMSLNGLEYSTEGDEQLNEKIRHHVGFLSGSTGLYKRMTGRETLEFFGRMSSMEEENLQTVLEEFIARLGMADFIDRYTDKYSTGQKQKVNICRALIHGPDLLILDEATTGLDPVARLQVTEFIKKMRNPQRMMMYSTHYFDEAENLCDKLLVLHKGSLMYSGTKEEVLQQADCASLTELFTALANECKI